MSVCFNPSYGAPTASPTAKPRRQPANRSAREAELSHFMTRCSEVTGDSTRSDHTRCAQQRRTPPARAVGGTHLVRYPPPLRARFAKDAAPHFVSARAFFTSRDFSRAALFGWI